MAFSSLLVGWERRKEMGVEEMMVRLPLSMSQGVVFCSAAAVEGSDYGKQVIAAELA
jgi:hypothetical protein